MPIRNSFRGTTRRAKHGASRRQASAPFDRWLDRLVEIAVSIAMLVGGVALVMHFL